MLNAIIFFLFPLNMVSHCGIQAIHCLLNRIDLSLNPDNPLPEGWRDTRFNLFFGVVKSTCNFFNYLSRFASVFSE